MAGTTIEAFEMTDGRLIVQPETSRTAVAESVGPQVELIVTSLLPTRFGEFTIHGYRETKSGAEHVALARGSSPFASPTLVRIHSECLTGEAFGSRRCDCRIQLDLALTKIATAESGVIVYMRGHEGRGIGLINKLRAYALQDAGLDTACANSELGLPIDARDYRAAFSILAHMGIHAMRLMTNNPEKLLAATKAGFPVVERVPLLTDVTNDNERYLRAKVSKFGHLFPDL